ncbi:MAG: arginine deiminase-related protein [Cyclobacteriaceae bacterium]|nr:arginine deiminase-related protein [Cyclobacteriaceae bacterium]
MHQAPASVFMIRPAAFGYNPDTAGSNMFQQPLESVAEEFIRQKVLLEFDRMVDLLRSHDLDVHVFDDTPLPAKPDAQFPNNWISLHDDGTLVLYPMMALNRRAERRQDIVSQLKRGFVVNTVVDITGEEKQNRFLEGTGSLVFDYVNRIAYAARSPRTHEALVTAVAKKLGFTSLIFNAVDEQGIPVYHTNVMMCVGSNFAAICLDAVRGDEDQELLLKSLATTGHKVVAISYAQMRAFAGNMIEVRNRNNETYVLLSEQAFNSLLPGQVDAISRYAEMIPIAIPTIEKYGGGSVRCMIAGNFLPLRDQH